MTEAEHEARAREFVDSILEVNRRHGVDEESAVIEYDHAVEAAASTFRDLRNDSADQNDNKDGEEETGESA
jgi:hypothetical protein